jgi:hypothetical protein
VRMPDAIAHWVAGYVARHHVDEPFRKRRRTPQPGGERRNAIEEDGLG